MLQNPDYHDLLKLLERFEVEYLIIGGYAVNIYGYSRATGDLDIWINPSEENAEKMLKVMVLYGYPPNQFNKTDFTRKDSVMMFGDFKAEINLLCYADGLDDFMEAYTQKERFKVGDLELNFINLENLIKNKQTVGRLKDLSDIEKLKIIQELKNRNLDE